MIQKILPPPASGVSDENTGSTEENSASADETSTIQNITLDDLAIDEDYYSGNEIIATPEYLYVNGYRVNRGESITINGKTYTYKNDIELKYTGSVSGGSGSFDEASYNKITINGGEAHIDIDGGNFSGKLYRKAA